MTIEEIKDPTKYNFSKLYNIKVSNKEIDFIFTENRKSELFVIYLPNFLFEAKGTTKDLIYSGYFREIKKFDNLDKAYKHLLSFYRDLFKLLKEDEEINIYKLTDKEKNYIYDNLPKNTLSKMIKYKLDVLEKI